MQEGLGSIYLSSALKAFEQRGVLPLEGHAGSFVSISSRGFKSICFCYWHLCLDRTSLSNMIWGRGGVLLINFETCVYVTCNLKLSDGC